MKIKQTGIFFAVIYFAASLLTINVVKAQDVKEGYQRSSLHIINIENLNFDNVLIKVIKYLNVYIINHLNLLKHFLLYQINSLKVQKQ